jgi:hypothetical protein
MGISTAVCELLGMEIVGRTRGARVLRPLTTTQIEEPHERQQQY